MGHPCEGIHRLLRGGGRLHNFGKLLSWLTCSVWHHKEETRTVDVALRVLLALWNVTLTLCREQPVGGQKWWCASVSCRVSACSSSPKLASLSSSFFTRLETSAPCAGQHPRSQELVTVAFIFSSLIVCFSFNRKSSILLHIQFKDNIQDYRLYSQGDAGPEGPDKCAPRGAETKERWR